MTYTPLAVRRAERKSIVARVAVLLLTAALAGVAGCGAGLATEPGTEPNSNPNTNPNTNPAGMPPGVRQLVNIAAVDLPVTIYSGPGSDSKTGRTYNNVTVVVTAGTFEFVSAERFAMNINVRITADGDITKTSVHVDGTYEVQGPTFKFHPTSGLTRDFGGSRGNGVVTVHVDLVGSGEATYYNFD
jgi:hypothetical protein